MKKMLLIIAMMAVLTGCSSFDSGSNQPPEASIVSISPSEAREGETVTFVGQGTDEDGEVEGYLWRSDLDGELGRTAEFDTDSLSAGSHTIEFMVQDNNGEWSAKAHGSVTVVASEPPAVSFEASPATISKGESSTLSWDASNAESVSINQGIGTVESSDSMEVTPDTTTTYELTATSGSSVATATVDVTVEEAAHSVTLSPDSEMSGYVRSSGSTNTIDIFVGDDEANRGFQGFLTFNIASIPDDATLTRVVLDLSGYEVEYGAPLPDLGCLGAYEDEYNKLHGQFYTGDLPEPIAEWCSSGELDAAGDSAGLGDALQQKVGDNRFQLRLQFTGGETDGDSARDLLQWPRDQQPTLTVEFDT
ncbi:MAG: hypothetical protein ACOC9B_05885 [Chloroflexota bacterium]